MNIFFRAMRKAKKILFPEHPIGTIYMLHRCGPISRDNLYWNEHMKVSPEFLDEFLREQIREHDFISLDDVAELAATRRMPKKPFIAMTFDDGYRDNFEYALPVFERLKIPFAVYVTNCFPDRTTFLWWYILEDILQGNDTVALIDGATYTCRTKEEKEAVFLLIREKILRLNQDHLLEEFKSLLPDCDFDAQRKTRELCLSWEETREMSSSPYCTIGAHTMNHLALNQVADSNLDYEINESKRQIEAHIGKPVNHFSWPFGTPSEVGKREERFIRKSGFATVAYAHGGEVTDRNITRPLALPRVFLGELRK